MMRIKSLTMTAAGIASVGILLAIAGTAASLAADRPDESRPVTEPRTKVRVERVEDKKPARETVNRTYSVGDLVSSAFPIGTTSSQEVVETNGVTMGPLMDLISSTIEPGSWRTFDERGREIFPAPLSADQLRDRERLPGSITPFYLTLSLIIRAPENTQKKVADYLQKLRAVVDARDNTSKVDPELYKRHLKARLAQVGSVKSAEPQTTATPNVATKSINTAATPSLTPKPSSGARSRVDQLLEELRQEIAKLPKE